MALRLSGRLAKNFQRLLPTSHYFRLKSSLPSDWSGAAGKGGGAGGSIREAGGSFAKMELAREEQYFRKLQKDQIKMLHDHMEGEIREREMIIRELEKQIADKRKIIDDLKQHK
ncbi:uncharacterized protein LOC144111004 [Amblyomma americanum]